MEDLQGITPEEYVTLAMRTCKPGSNFHYDLNHALHGLATEVGEIADTIKRHIIYEQPFNYANIQEEIGDLLWYVALLCASTRTSMQRAMEENIRKLQKRYPDRFTPEAAVARADKQ